MTPAGSNDKILVTYPLEAPARAFLESSVHGSAIRFDTSSPTDENLRWATVIFGNIADPARLTDVPGLRWLHSPSAGLDAYEDVPAQRPDLEITHPLGVYDQAVAEHGVFLLLGLYRRFALTSRAQADRRWARSDIGADPPRLLGGSRVHVLGYGSIARRLVRSLTSLGCVVTVFRRTVVADGPVPMHEVGELVSRVGDADALMSVLPGGSETRHLVGASVFAAMRADAVFVNLGRGSTVDEPALVDAVASGTIAGAALDVFETEPLPDGSPLWHHPRITVTPHIAGRFAGEAERQCQAFVDRLTARRSDPTRP